MIDATFTQEIRWLLKDKYRWPEGKISAALQVLEWKKENFSPEIQADLERLEAGEPLAYVIGWIKFLDCIIDLRYKPLIPRPETEYWVEQVIQEYQDRQSTEPLEILDLCCGSGCIGIACLKHLPNSTVEFVDISEQAIQQTQLNLALNELETERTIITQSDLFAELHSQHFDLILTNPPYVNPSGDFGVEIGWEPQQALFAQKNGLGLIEQILQKAQKYLKPGGELIVEFGKDQEKELLKLAQQFGYSQSEVFPDQFGVMRFLRARSKS